MKSRSGFSLLEVLVATVVMGIAVTGLIVGLSQSVKNASRLADYDRAAMLARTKMNDLLLDVTLPFEGAVEGTFDNDQAGVPSGWKAVLKPFDSQPEAGPGSLVLQQIALQVWWQPPAGTRRNIEIESYRPTRIPVLETR
ncbi:MAG: prepilin-type N-terminal cleavage/methylation domain-containing protein [Acidobacteriota bacterium]